MSNSFGALVGALYLMVGTAVMMGTCMAKFSFPFAASLFVLTVNLQLVDVANRSRVWRILAIEIFTAVWTIVINAHRFFQALLAEDLPTAACLLGLSGKKIANEADVAIRGEVANKLIVISSLITTYYSR